MLTATSDTRHGTCRLRTAFILARGFRGQLVARHRLLFDSRYAVPARQPRDVASIYLVLAGQLATATGEVSGPTALVLAEREFERVEPGAPWFRSWGDPAVVFNLRVARSDVRGPIGLEHGPRQLTGATWQALAELAAQRGEGGHAYLEEPTLELLRGLHASGVLTHDLGADLRPEPYIVRRLWAAVRPLYAELMCGATLPQFGELRGASVRQLAREFTALTTTLPLFGGYRDSVVLLRLRLATLLLSQPSLPTREVAAAAGYASVDALATALRDAGLPSPSVVRAATRYPEA